jgi:hypothetical protein
MGDKAKPHISQLAVTVVNHLIPLYYKGLYTAAQVDARIDDFLLEYGVTRHELICYLANITNYLSRK